jgi:hypothetical protein
VTTSPWGSNQLHEGGVLGAGIQYAVLPGLSVGLDYMFTLYGPQDHGSVANVAQLFNSSFGGVGAFLSVQRIPSNFGLVANTARVVMNYTFE